MKLPRLSNASRTVLVMLLGIAFLELGISHRFGQVWNLAFQPSAPQQTGAPQAQQTTPGQTQPSSGVPL